MVINPNYNSLPSGLDVMTVQDFQTGNISIIYAGTDSATVPRYAYQLSENESAAILQLENRSRAIQNNLSILIEQVRRGIVV